MEGFVLKSGLRGFASLIFFLISLLGSLMSPKVKTLPTQFTVQAGISPRLRRGPQKLQESDWVSVLILAVFSIALFWMSVRVLKKRLG